MQKQPPRRTNCQFVQHPSLTLFSLILILGLSACRSPQTLATVPTPTSLVTPAAPPPTSPITSQPPAATTTATTVQLTTAAPTTAGPTPTPSITPTPSSTPPTPRQLTTGRCCFQPFFLDGRLTFMDRPTADGPVGFYAVPPAGGAPELVESRLGTFHNDGAFFAYVDNGYTIVEQRSDGQQWRFYNEEQPILLSPDGRTVAWVKYEWEGLVDERRAQFWWMELGDRPAFVTSVLGGGLIEWLADGRWLAAGRLQYTATDGVLFVYEPATRQRLDLFTASWFRGVLASPDGRWVIFLVGQDPQPERNGLWLARTDGSELRRLDWFGAYTWRDPNHLVYLPFQPGATSDELWLYDVTANTSQRLTDPSQTPFKVAQSDFTLTPDGRALIYVSAADNNLWLLPIPDP